MPFQSEKQRRYLWANEPEIARDWTDTYGSGIAKALGGRIGFFKGAQADTASGKSMSPGTSASGGSRGGGGPPGGGDRQMTYTAPAPTPTHTDRIIDVAQRKKRQDVRDLLARQQAEKDYGRFGKIKPGPQLGWAGSGAGPNIGNWASGFAGSKIGGGLGSMLFGPLGMLLGSLFGQEVGRRAYKASQTDEKETAKDILLGQNTLLSNLFTKPTTGGEGLGGIKNKFVDDYNYRPSEKMYWDEQQVPMPKNLDADIMELEEFMNSPDAAVEQKHINLLQALKTARHNKMREENPDRPGTRVKQLWE